MDPYRVIKRPYISEKGYERADKLNTYTFVVDVEATKVDIRDALQTIWGVTPKSIRTILTHGKKRRYGKNIGSTRPIKKAMVRLADDQSIEVLK